MNRSGRQCRAGHDRRRVEDGRIEAQEQEPGRRGAVAEEDVRRGEGEGEGRSSQRRWGSTGQHRRGDAGEEAGARVRPADAEDGGGVGRRGGRAGGGSGRARAGRRETRWSWRRRCGMGKEGSYGERKKKEKLRGEEEDKVLGT